MTTLVPDTVDYLVALFKAAPTLGAADPAVEVIDGPVPNSGSLPLALWVGVDDLAAASQNDATLAGESQKERSDMGLGRQEAITIPCVAAAWTGNEQDGYGAIRAKVAVIVKAVESVVTGDTGAPAQFQNPGVTAAQWWQRPLNGLQVYVPFQIIYLAL